MDIQDLRQQSASDRINVFQIYRFHIEDDLVFINHWLSKRGLEHWPASELPAIGFMVYSNFIPVAAAFLRSCEGKIALFDSLVADPDCYPTLRDKCIDELVRHVLGAAKDHGFKKVLGYTLNKSTLERSFRHGFVLQPHSVISITLPKE